MKQFINNDKDLETTAVGYVSLTSGNVLSEGQNNKNNGVVDEEGILNRINSTTLQKIGVVMLMLSGVLMLTVGVVVLLSYMKYEPMLTQPFFAISYLAVLTGFLILFTSILGFCGVVSKQLLLIVGYVAMLVLVLILELTIYVISFDLKEDTARKLYTPMMGTLNLYGSRDQDMIKMWDDMQIKFTCCGASHRDNWSLIGTPMSCCYIPYGTISPFQCDSTRAYYKNCAAALAEWLTYKTNLLAVTTFTMFSLHVFLVGMAIWSVYKSRSGEPALKS